MKTYIKFQDVSSPDKKTKCWRVVGVADTPLLGLVKWYAPWRRYCFFPADNTTFDIECMRTIVNYIEMAMQDRKNDHET